MEQRRPGKIRQAGVAMLTAQPSLGAQIRSYSCRNRAQLDHHAQPVPNDLALDDLVVCNAEGVDENQVESLTRRGYRTERRFELAALSASLHRRPTRFS
jgi:hypothetical protein